MFSSILMRELMNLKNVDIIDVRNHEEHRTGIIPGAICIPMDQIASAMPKLSKEKTYYIVCQSGSRSQVVCSYLADNGYNAVNVMGGMSAYFGEVSYEV